MHKHVQCTRKHCRCRLGCQPAPACAACAIAEDTYAVDILIATSGIDEHATQPVKLPLLLPHAVFGALARQGSARWQKSVAGPPGQRALYWQHVLAHSAWAAQHPLHEHFQASTAIPIALYGDSAKVTKDDSLCAMTWSSVLVGKSKSADVKMLIFAFPKSGCCQKVWMRS